MTWENFAKLSSFLRDAGIEDYDFEARIIEHDMPGREWETAKRRAEGEPLQYLLGEWEFYGLPFKVGEGVLIPRPDTETLIETALEHLKNVENSIVIDLCSGSGCIAVTLSKLIPNAEVFAVELSEKALFYLEQNIKLNNAAVSVISGDILSPLLTEKFADKAFDLIISNPPYLDSVEMLELQKEVTHEPKMALFGGNNGLDFYRAIPALWRKSLKKGGLLALEIGYNQAAAVADILKSHNYNSVEIKKDLAGNDRVVTGVKS